MTPSTLGLILISVTISGLAQIFLKLGMASPVVQHALPSSGVMYAMMTSPAVIGGLALYGLGAISWLFVLAKADVSQAYPFVGLSFLVTLAIAYFFLAEPVSPLRIAGVLLIMAGIGMVSQS